METANVQFTPSASIRSAHTSASVAPASLAMAMSVTMKTSAPRASTIVRRQIRNASTHRAASNVAASPDTRAIMRAAALTKTNALMEPPSVHSVRLVSIDRVDMSVNARRD